MQILNLADLEKSDVKYSISRFPDGEIQITLGEFSRKDEINVKCRITSAEDLFILMQVADILVRSGMYFSISIYYLMGMRMDRVMDFNRPFTLKVVGNVIKGLGASRIELLEPHSGASYTLTGSDYDDVYPSEELYEELHPDNSEVFNKYLVVYPDAGAAERYKWSHRASDPGVVVAEKVRDVATGRIESIRITNPELFADNNKPIMVVDDLCDGGGTFVGLATEIRKYTDKELNIFVTHMVNPKGIETLSKTYDHVYITNSYKNWKKLLGFPKNVTQIDVI